MTLFYALIALGSLALIFGLILGFAAVRFRVESNPIVDQIDTILPQTQCGQCGYPGCRPYAEAIANGDEINKCPPGGEATVKKLADLMGVEAKPLAGGEQADPVKTVAYIREDECIGCSICIHACPVVAIVGVVAVEADASRHYPAFDVDTGSTLAAGDAFNGALAAGLAA